MYMPGGGSFQQAAPSTHAAGDCYITLHAREAEGVHNSRLSI